MIFGYIDPTTGYVVASGIGAFIAMLATFWGLVLARFRRVRQFFLRRMLLTYTLGLAVPIAALAHLTYYNFQGKPMPIEPVNFTGRVIILGIDGMNPPTLERLMAAGKMPNFTRLAAWGGYRHLATTNPSESPVAWMGFATGKNPGHHGLTDFIHRDPATMELELSTSKHDNDKYQPVSKEKRLWNYLTDFGVESVFLNCPITFPTERINGRMLSGMGTPDALGTEGTFTFYTSASSSLEVESAKIEQVGYSSKYIKLPIYGPRRNFGGNRIENVVVPMDVVNDYDEHQVKITVKDSQPFTLKEGKWSPWQQVTFSLGLFKKMKGMVCFYLVSTKPDFQLYASPVNFDPSEPYFPISFPDTYANELTKPAGGLYHTLGMPNETWSLNEKRLPEQAFIDRVRIITEQKSAILHYELDRQRQGVVFGYFDALDVLQHMFWRYTDPSSPMYEAESPFRTTIDDWYINMDKELGKVMDTMGKGDTLLVLSDHGFASFRRAVHLNAWLREHGYLALKTGKTDGGELLQDVDWSKTKAYALGFGSLYLNLKGRDKFGIVPNNKQVAALKAQLRDELLAWRDADGSPIFHNIYYSEEIYSGALTNSAPDLVVGYNDGYRASWQTAVGACPATLVEDNTKKWAGDHLIDPSLVPGILLSNQRLPEQASIYDLTPTVLRTIGVSAKRIKELGFDGVPLFDVAGEGN